MDKHLAAVQNNPGIDKLSTPRQVNEFLRELGLRLTEDTVRRIVRTLSDGGSLFSVYGRKKGSSPLCGKGTAYKIKRLLDSGELQPYLDWLSPNPTSDQPDTSHAGVEETIAASRSSTIESNNPASRIAFAGLIADHYKKLEGCLNDFQEGIGFLPPGERELETWRSRPHEPQWPIPNGHIRRCDEGGYEVRLSVENQIGWKYLQQHFHGDPIWQAVRDWKSDVVKDIAGRLGLYDALSEEILRGTGLQIVDDIGKATTGSDALGSYYLHTLYQQVFRRVLGLRNGLKARNEFLVRSDHRIELGNEIIAVTTSPHKADVVIDFLLDAQTALTAIRAAPMARDAYFRVEESTQAVRGELDRVRLSLVHLCDTTCDGCRRICDPASSPVPPSLSIDHRR